MKMLKLGAIALLVGVAGGAFLGGNKAKAVIMAEHEQHVADSLAALGLDEHGYPLEGEDTHASADTHGGEAPGAATPDGAADEGSHGGATTQTAADEQSAADTHATDPATGPQAQMPVNPAALPQSDPQNTPPAQVPVQAGVQQQPSTPAPAANEGAEKLASIFEAMRPNDAAAVLQEMEDSEVKAILKFMGDRKAAAIIGAMSPERAAVLTRVVLAGGGNL